MRLARMPIHTAKEVIVRRHSVNKSRSSRKFRNQVGRTKVANMRGPMRGGFRF